MTLTIELSPIEEAWIAEQASRQGTQPTDIVRRLIDDQLPSSVVEDAEPPAKPPIDAKNAAAIALLNSWMEEDATDDPDAIRQAEEEFEELKRNLNANRAATGDRLVFP